MINVLWTELPIFVHLAVEGDRIAARLAVATQLANVAPAAFVAVQRLRRARRGAAARGDLATASSSASPRKQQPQHAARDASMPPPPPPNRRTVLTVLSGACGLGVVFTLLPNELLFGRSGSWGFLALTFCAGCVGCLSTVTLWPFATCFRPSLLTALSTGMGLAGLLPSLVGIAQRPGAHPRFSSRVFGAAAACVLALSLAAFALAAFASFFDEFRCDLLEPRAALRRGDAKPADDADRLSSRELAAPVESSPLLDAAADTADGDLDAGVTAVTVIGAPLLAKPSSTSSIAAAAAHARRIKLLVAAQFAVCFLNFALTALSTYLVTGFREGRDRDSVLMWFVIAPGIANALARLASRTLVFPTALQHAPQAATAVALQRALWLCAAQSVAFALLWVFGYPLALSAPLLIAAKALQDGSFGLNTTLIYQAVAAGAPQRVHLAAYAEQFGSASSTALTFALVQFAM
jgi:hypothetical protein